MDQPFQQYFEENRKLWDSRVEVHVKSDLYKMESFLAGHTSLTEIERHALGDVSGKTVLHLQCHFGQDTLSLAREGALVTGVDFSGKAIEKAREISQETGLHATFIESNIYDLPSILEGSFDIVFTTFGAIPWLPDLETWAGIIGRYVKKGGIFYIAEFHPTLYLFNFDNYQVEYGYFQTKLPYEEIVQGSYADKEGKTGGKEYFWNHSLSEVLNPLMKQGMSLVQFNEFDFSPYNCFPNMMERSPGRYVWGTRLGVSIPHVFSMTLKKEGI